MPTTSIPYSLQRAHSMVGRRVRLTAPMGGFPAGLVGTVTDYHPYRAGYVLEVQWEGMSPRATIQFELFTRDDFERSLMEC